jgi:ABC-2 type transport system permease protein
LVSPEVARPRDAQRTVELLAVVARRELRLTGLLFRHELREVLVSRALWSMVFVSALLVGFSFLQAVQLYSGSSQNAQRLPQLAASLSPLDGIVIPTFGGVYLMNTFLLPFVAIRLIGNEKQTGALKLLLQLPIGPNRTIGVKLIALGVGWLIALVPTLSALLIWSTLLGGHLYVPELLSVFLGHALYALVIVGFAFLAASLTESSATAAIVTLSFTLGAWILEFAGGAGSGLVKAIAAFSLSPALRGLERGLFGSPTALTLLVLGLGFLALTVVWLPPGVSRTQKLIRSGAVAGIAAQALLLVIQLPLYVDVSEDHRNSFNPADERALRQMTRELKVQVNLAANDSRLRDLERNVLTKLQRTAPHVTITYSESSGSGLLGGTSGQNYGLVTFTYAGRQGASRATTSREVLPLIHKLAGNTVVPDPTAAYPGYPLVTDASAAGVWFYVGLPVLAVAGWWLNQQPPGSLWSTSKPKRRAWLGAYDPVARRGILVVGGALVAVQLIPYGRDHANLSVGQAPAAVAQACQAMTSGPTSSRPLGDLRRQIGNLVGNLDLSLASAGTAGVRTGYAQFSAGYDGVARGVAILYPGRCPRLAANQAALAAALRASQPDPGQVSDTLRALRAGVAAIGQDLDMRIRQDSPDDLVGEQPREAEMPSLTGVPVWNTPRAEELAARACAACHSNQPRWPWYTNLAPLSWVVQHNVDAGRAALNLSEWDRPQAAAVGAAASVQSGSMPPAWAGLVDARLTLSTAERAELGSGLHVALVGEAAAPRASGALLAVSPAVVAVLGVALIGLGYLRLRERRASPDRGG